MLTVVSALPADRAALQFVVSAYKLLAKVIKWLSGEGRVVEGMVEVYFYSQ